MTDRVRTRLVAPVVFLAWTAAAWAAQPAATPHPEPSPRAAQAPATSTPDVGAPAPGTLAPAPASKAAPATGNAAAATGKAAAATGNANTTAPAANPDGPQPVLVIDNPGLDLGLIKEGDEAVATFILKNTGNAELRILSARPG